MTTASTNVVTAWPLTDAKTHRFGLNAVRWHTLASGTYWVIGAGTGYGRAVAIALIASGARVILSGRRETLLRRVIAEAVALGYSTGRTEALTLDISDNLAIARECGNLEPKLGPDGLTGVVLTAAQPGTRDAIDTNDDQWNTIFDTNVRAAWRLLGHSRELLHRCAHPRVVLFSSQAAWSGGHGVGLYGISKAALNSLAQTLAEEYRRRHIGLDMQINVVDPGEAATEMNRGSSTDPAVVNAITLLLLSHPPGGPNGCFFDRDGRHLAFGYTAPYQAALNC